MPPIKYSIITATYDADKFIERAMASILGQSYPCLEWILQDGGSQDNTLDLVKKCGDPRIKLVSEPDKGIYDAWNKGVARAEGDWAIFLGADDFFLTPDSLAKCHRHIKRMEKQILFAYAATARLKGVQLTQLDNFSLFEVHHRFSNRMGLPMPSTFIRMNLLKQYPFEAELYKICADFDFVARFYTGDNVARIPVAAVGMEVGGTSTTPANTCLLFDESCKVLHRRILPRAAELMTYCINHYWHRDMALEE